MTGIPQRFIRVWLGEKPIKPRFEKWWSQFRSLHSEWEALTIGDAEARALIPELGLQIVYDDVPTQAARADIIRLAALRKYGGVYLDVDVMPLKSLEPLRMDPRPFAAHASSKQLMNSVIGAPAGHPAIEAVLERLPDWYWEHAERAASVATGPALLTDVWWNRNDVRKLPKDTFFPYKLLFGTPKARKEEIFAEAVWPEETLAVHYSDHVWGGRPKSKIMEEA